MLYFECLGWVERDERRPSGSWKTESPPKEECFGVEALRREEGHAEWIDVPAWRSARTETSIVAAVRTTATV